METRTLGLITVGQVLGRGVQEATPYLDTQMSPIMGQPVSRIAEVGGGLALMALAATKSKRKYSADAQLTAAIIGSRLLADEMVNIAKQYLTPSGAAAGLRMRTPNVRVTNVPRAMVASAPYAGSANVTVD